MKKTFEEGEIPVRKRKTVTDMTTGSPMRHLLVFALPLLVGNIFQQLYMWADSIVVGNFVNGNALAAVGNCGSTNFLFFSLSSGLAIGIGIIVAQYFGAKDEKNVRCTIANSLYVLISASLFISVVGYLITPFLFSYVLETPPEILQDSIIYMRTTCLGIVGIALYNGCAAVLRALGDSVTPLIFLVVSSVINIGLDLFFVLALEMGVAGVALATIISQAVSAATCMVYGYHRNAYFRLTKEELKPNMDIILRSFRLGLPVALQNSMIAVSCIVLQRTVNGFGPEVMTAYTATNRIEMLVQQPYGSLGMALTTYSGQNAGANKPDRVKKGFRQATLMALVFSICLIPVMYIFGSGIAWLFDKREEVISIATGGLRITSLCYFGLGMIYVPRAVLNGCGDAGFAMVNGVTEVLCRILYAPLLTSIPALGFWGVWVTTIATWCTTAVVCLIRFQRGKWKSKFIVQNETANGAA